MMKRNAGFIIALIVLFLFAWGRTGYLRHAFIVADGFAQGTTYHIIARQTPLQVFFRNDTAIDLKTRVDSILDRFDRSLSIYRPGSIISRINRNEENVRTDSMFNVVFRVSREVYDETGGAFDITVGPLVRAWGFGPQMVSDTGRVNVDSLLSIVGMDKVRLEDDHVIKSDTAVKLDVNAIAQGYSVDVVSEWLRSQGFGNYLVEIGGEVRTAGNKGLGRPWRVGVDKPEDNNVIPGQELQAIVQLSGMSLATSGNYRKFYIRDGIKYAHTIDPHTGYPARNRLLSVTIITRQCIYADAYATACMVIGLEKSQQFIRSRDDLEAMFIYSGDDGAFLTWESEGFAPYVVEEK